MNKTADISAPHGTTFRIFLELLRFCLAFCLLFSGGVKAIDPMGGAIKIKEYLWAFGLESFDFLAVLASFNLCIIEFIIGFCLLIGMYRTFISFIILSFMSGMTLLTLYLALFDPVSDCGCFGDALILSNWETFGKNLILSAAAVVVFLNNKQLLRLLPTALHWFAAVFSFFSVLIFAWWNYNHLPIIDFRPFKVGAHIPTLMTVPEGAPVDEYEHTIVYEKDGVRKSFALDSVPVEDSTWVFVEAQSVLVKQGEKPLVESFPLFDEKGEDVSELVFSQTKDVYLLVLSDAETANEEYIDQINDLYDKATADGNLFYAVIGSSDASFQEWSDYTGAAYPYFKTDATLLKTFIRSNPGLVLLRKGTIVKKWHYNDFEKALSNL